MDMEVYSHERAAFFRSESKPDGDTELCLTVCGIRRCFFEKYCRPAIQDDYHIYFVLSGKGRLKIGEKTYYLNRGQIFLIPPNIDICYYADYKDPWQYMWISFRGTRAELYLEKVGLMVECPVRDTFQAPEVFLALGEKILKHQEMNTADELIRTALLCEILSLLISHRGREPGSYCERQQDESLTDRYVDRAVEYIHNNYANTRVSEIASYIGVNRSYLTHLFKQKLSVSMQEYLLGYRLEQGSKLLKMTDLPIQKVAERIGYSNPLTFSKVFKNAYGLSPKNYRLQMQNGQKPRMKATATRDT